MHAPTNPRKTLKKVFSSTFSRCQKLKEKKTFSCLQTPVEGDAAIIRLARWDAARPTQIVFTEETKIWDNVKVIRRNVAVSQKKCYITPRENIFPRAYRFIFLNQGL